MKKNKVVEVPFIGSSAQELLAMEIKHVEQMLQHSCYWAGTLAEQIAGYDDAFLENVRLLAELEESAKKTQLDKATVVKIRKVLRGLRIYSRRMAVGEPPSTNGIIESMKGLYFYSKGLDDLLKDG